MGVCVEMRKVRRGNTRLDHTALLAYNKKRNKERRARLGEKFPTEIKFDLCAAAQHDALTRD
jgi:hypothetical protein